MARAPLLAAALCWAVLVMSVAPARQSGDHPLLRREQRGLGNLGRADASMARGATCRKGSRTCGRKCVNTGSDPNNCGRCGRTCESGSCKRGNCQCPRGRTQCLVYQTRPAPSAVAKCNNLRTDDRNCGKCGKRCQGSLGGNVPQVCRRGQCRCPNKAKWCYDVSNGWTCVDSSASIYHCGKCNNVCPDGASCKKGICMCPKNTKPVSCPIDESGYMGLFCLNLKTDPNNCGSCGNECPGKCANGTCVCTLPGYTQCGAACADLKNDPARCGSCNNNCGEQVTPSDDVWCCNGQCPNNNNCGKCGLKCAANQECCFTICGPDGLRCHLCVDLSSDFFNCGTCGNICNDGSCKNGKCKANP